MAVINMTIFSRVLEREDTLTIVFPEEPGKCSSMLQGAKYQVLWLVHGGTSNHYTWLRDSRIEPYASEYKLVVIMPTIRDLHEVNQGCGNYRKYLAEELPEIMGGILPISKKREDNFIAAFSYGGYFIFRTVVQYPQKYGLIATFSSPLDRIMDSERVNRAIDRAVAEGTGKPIGYRKVEELRNTEYDLPYVIKKCWEDKVDLPFIYSCSGTEDMTYKPNLHILEVLRETGYAHAWMEDPGNHNFSFWSRHLKYFMEWCPFIKRTPILEEI